MKRLNLLIVFLIVPFLLMAKQVSIFEIQFTNNPGSDGTYPSSYRGRIVTTTGIVTAINHAEDGFYISEPQGGPWRGIYVEYFGHNIRIGDNIELTSEVSESFGFTMLRNIYDLKIIASGNPLPKPYSISTHDLATNEAYEGVLVKLNNVTVKGQESRRGVFIVDDGSGSCRINNTILNEQQGRKIALNNDSYSTIVGVVDYRFGEYRLNPRDNDDFTASPLGTNKPSWGRIKFLYR